MENTGDSSGLDGQDVYRDDTAHVDDLLRIIDGDPANETYQAVDDDAAEHQAIGNAVQLIDDWNAPYTLSTDLKLFTVSAYTGAFHRNKNVELYFGRIVGLAGDFYTTQSFWCRPISDNLESAYTPNPKLPDPPYSTFNPKHDTLFREQRHRFGTAVDSLVKDVDKYLYFVFESFDKEVSGIEDVAKDQTLDPDNQAQAYHHHEHGIPEDTEWAWDTTGLGNFTVAKYAKIAWTNFDHFHVDAVTAYGVGHSLALDRAIIAKKEIDTAIRKQKLKLAYLTEAFAAHYLTDLFSSGHTRAPRRQLHNTSFIGAGIDGVVDSPVNDAQCRYMHDDDSATGLLVRNAAGVEWVAYGDKQLFLPHNSLNLYYAVQGVNAGVQEIINAFNTGLKPVYTEYAALNAIPGPQPAYASIAKRTKSSASDRLFDSGSPLWIYDNATDKFTIRTTIQDHSDFGNRPFALQGDRPAADPRSNDETSQTIKDSSFRGDDQFPNTRRMIPFTGGFAYLQILPLDDPISSWQMSLNAFGLIDLPDVLKPGFRTKCFTLRSRSTLLMKGFYNETKQTVPLYWCRWNSGEKNSLVLFTEDRSNSATKNVIKCTSMSLVARGSVAGNQEVRIEEVDTHALKVAGTDFENFPLCNQTNQSSANLMRFFSSSSLVPGQTAASNPALASIGWVKQANESYAAQISVAINVNGKDPKLITQASGWIDQGQRSVGDIDGVFKICSSPSTIIHVTLPKDKTKPSKISREWWVESDHSIKAASPRSEDLPILVVAVLIGKVINVDGDQLVVISGSWPKYDVTIYRTPGTGQPWVQHARLDGSTVNTKWTAADLNTQNNVLQDATFK